MYFRCRWRRKLHISWADENIDVLTICSQIIGRITLQKVIWLVSLLPLQTINTLPLCNLTLPIQSCVYRSLCSLPHWLSSVWVCVCFLPEHPKQYQLKLRNNNTVCTVHNPSPCFCWNAAENQMAKQTAAASLCIPAFLLRNKYANTHTNTHKLWHAAAQPRDWLVFG